MGEVPEKKTLEYKLEDIVELASPPETPNRAKSRESYRKAPLTQPKGPIA